ncbi:hypothetical protein [Leifsonia sp. LS-T14]|uniref:hypothetical protein n=1 Tax=unclassified Leifsonia TaxID=2663824 RepID=UPI0035A65C99
MDRTRLWIIGSVLAMAVIGVLGWLVGIQPQLDQATAASDQTIQAQSSAAANAAILAKMKKDSENVPALKKQLADLAVSVPKTRELADYADELTGLATANGLTVLGMTVGDGQGYKAPQIPGAAPAPAAGGAAAGSTPAPTPTPTPTPGAAGAATAAPTPPVVTAGVPPAASELITSQNLVFVPVSFSVRGSEDQILAFVGAAQKTKRLFLVDGISIDPPAGGGAGYDAKASGYVYVLNPAEQEVPAK